MSAESPPAIAVTLKLATSLDGKIALADGRSKWITGPQSRAAAHRLRAAHDVVLTGIGTVLADNPALTARDAHGLIQRQPTRAVLDSDLRTPPSAALLTGEGGPVVILTTASSRAPAWKALSEAGARLHGCAKDADGRPLWSDVMRALSDQGAASVMIEAGGRVAASALTAGLVDRLEWFRAPIILGAEGLDVFAALGLEALVDAPIFVREDVQACGADLHERYRRSE